MQALIKGEVDIIEIPQTDLLPLIRKDPNISVKVIDRVGTQAIYRMNHLIPPFNNAKARQALLYATGDQKDYLSSMIGFADYERPCWAVFVCGTPFETQAGVGDWAKGDKKANVEKAKQLLKEAGYKGEKVVILDPVEAQLAHAQAVVTAQKLREIGMNVDLQAIDWGTQSARRQIKDPPDKNPGAWNIFHTWGGGLAMNSPLSNTPTPSSLRRQELVRLALRRGAREDPPRIPAGASREAEGDRRAPAEALLRSRSVHSRPASSLRRSPIARAFPASWKRPGSCSGTSRKSKPWPCAKSVRRDAAPCAPGTRTSTRILAPSVRHRRRRAAG